MITGALAILAYLVLLIFTEVEIGVFLAAHLPGELRDLVTACRRRWWCPRGRHRDAVCLDTTWMYYKCVDCKSVRELGNVIFGVSNAKGGEWRHRRRRRKP